MNFFKTLVDILRFLRSQKKLWLSPLVIILVLVAALLLAAAGSILAPFIYTLF